MARIRRDGEIVQHRTPSSDIGAEFVCPFDVAGRGIDRDDFRGFLEAKISIVQGVQRASLFTNREPAEQKKSIMCPHAVENVQVTHTVEKIDWSAGNAIHRFSSTKYSATRVGKLYCG